jgi:hypothetical protein
MSNEFNIKNGFISKGDGLINGGLTTQTLTITSGATNGYVLTSNVSGNATWKDLNSILPYKIYSALLNQTGTNNPVDTVLENTLGNIVWTRGGVGYYIATLSGSFTTNKTTVLFGNPLYSLPPIDIISNLGSINSVDINVISNGVLTDSLLSNTFIEIRVYN